MSELDFARIGKNNYAICQAPGNFEYPTGNFTWELMIRTRSYYVARMFQKRQGSNQGWVVSVANPGRVQFAMYKSTGASIALATAPVTPRVDDGEWHKIVCVCDRANTTAEDRKLHMWLDGELAASSDAFGAEYDTDIGSTSSQVILRSYASADLAHPVDYREIRHYDRALTPSEVAKVYANDYDDLDPIAYFPCDDGKDTRFQYNARYLTNRIERPIVCTADADTDTFTAVGHGLKDQQTVRFESTGDIPTGLSDEAGYFVVNTAADTFQVEASPAGGAVNITTDGTGVITVHPTYAFYRDKKITGHELGRIGTNEKILEVALWADLHHKQAGSTVANLADIVGWTARRNISLLVGLGDMIDGENAEGDLTSLAEIKSALDAKLPRVTAYCVLGNHDKTKLTRTQVSGALGATYMPIDNGNLYHALDWPTVNPKVQLIFLDAHDGETYLDISATQLAWLEATLTATDLPSVIFIHNRTDWNPDDRAWGAGNASSNPLTYAPIPTMRLGQAIEFRAIVDAAPNQVYAVCCGHTHSQHYCKLKDTHYVNIDGSAVAGSPNACLLTVYADGDIRWTGYGVTQKTETRR